MKGKGENFVKKKKHIFEWNSKYFTISVYSVAVILVGAIIFHLVSSLTAVMATIRHFIGVISPFLIGALIAYMMNPLISIVYLDFFKKRLKIKKKKQWKLVAVLLCYGVVFGIFGVCLNYVVPQFVESIAEITVSIPKIYDSIMGWVVDTTNQSHKIGIPEGGRLFLIQNLPKVYRYLEQFMTKSIPMLYDLSMQAIKFIINLCIAFMISIYLSLDRKILLRAAKKLIYALFNPTQARKIMVTGRECNQIFSRYLSGKAIDSIIIGILCYIAMNIIHLPLAALISMIVGVTNMIPCFGPFIGAVPGICLLAILNPFSAVKFAILVFILQQFDGYILGPKILGDSTGVRPIGILFAIIVGGAYFGAVGMFLGVPVFAVIQYLVQKYVEERLSEKGIHIEE